MDDRYQMVTTREELNDAFSIRDVVFVKEQSVPREIEMDQYDDNAIHFIVYDQKKPIATARIRPYKNNKNILKVERVAVLAEYRKYGVGKKLMNYIEHEAKKMGYSTFVLNSQRHAEPFYSKLGYVIVSEPFFEANIEHVTMEKKIEAV